MSESGDTPIGDAPATGGKKPRRGNRRITVFILVFAVSVLSVLTGYRYLVGTEINAWYLFQVANHTSLVLSVIGESATLEGLSEVIAKPVKQVRAERAAWARGDKTPAQEDFDQASDAPLSAWEQYAYRFEQRRAQTGHSTLGPRLSFVLKRTTTTDLQEARTRLDLFTRDTRGKAKTEAQNAEESALKAEIGRLTQVLQEERSNASKDKRPKPYAFSFFVISECGAIEVMAIFFSAVIAFPTTWRKRLIGLVFGLPLMYLLNIGRLSCLAIIGSLDASKGRQVFDFAHEYVWQAVYIVFIVVVWMIWIEFVVRRRAR